MFLLSGNVEFVTVKGLKDVYSDDGSVTISFEVSGGVAEGERVEWTWSDPYITLTPGQSDGSYHATDKQVMWQYIAPLINPVWQTKHHFARCACV